MQIQTGSCVVNNGSATVTASAGNDWSTVTIGSLFCVVGDGVFYAVTGFTAPGSSLSGRWEITLAANYAGADAAAAHYAISIDFTPNFHLPLIKPGDSATAALFSTAMTILDGILHAVAPHDDLAGHSLKILRVNVDETAIEYVDEPETGVVFDTVTLQSATAAITSSGNWLCIADLSATGAFTEDFIDVAIACRRADNSALVTKSTVVQEVSRCNKTTAAVVIFVPTLPTSGYTPVAIHVDGKARGIGWDNMGTVSFLPTWTFTKLA